MNQLPETGFLTPTQILGHKGLSDEQAAENRRLNEKAEELASQQKQFDAKGSPKYRRRPTTPRPPSVPIIPVGKTCWWAGVKSGRFPAPVRLGSRLTVWRVEDIREFIARSSLEIVR